MCWHSRPVSHLLLCGAVGGMQTSHYLGKWPTYWATFSLGLDLAESFSMSLLYFLWTLLSAAFLIYGLPISPVHHSFLVFYFIFLVCLLNNFNLTTPRISLSKVHDIFKILFPLSILMFYSWTLWWFCVCLLVFAMVQGVGVGLGFKAC